MVAALTRWGMDWAATAINFVLMTAILSTMLAAMFGLGRMIRSLADAGQAPRWLKDDTDIPRRGILFSGFGMLVGLGFGFLLPRVYLFLVSSGGFAALLTYTAIVATHIRFRKKNGCPTGKCKMRGYPYSSLFVLISLIAVMLSMPLIPGQGYGFIAGLIITALYYVAYLIMKHVKQGAITNNKYRKGKHYQEGFSMEMSEEFTNHSNYGKIKNIYDNEILKIEENDGIE
jgi:L-asparagine transporter-like permease